MSNVNKGALSESTIYLKRTATLLQGSTKTKVSKDFLTIKVPLWKTFISLVWLVLAIQKHGSTFKVCYMPFKAPLVIQLTKSMVFTFENCRWAKDLKPAKVKSLHFLSRAYLQWHIRIWPRPTAKLRLLKNRLRGHQKDSKEYFLTLNNRWVFLL